MIHLIGKLYLTTDKNIDKDTNRVVISDAFGFPELGRFDESHNDLYEGILIGYAQSNNVPEDYTSWGDMITNLITVSAAENSKVYIYADTSSSTEILTAWFKMLLPAASAATIHSLILSYNYKLELVDGNDTNPLIVKDFDVYQAVFSATAPLDINIDYNEVSIEFLLASYINDGSYSTELIHKLRVILKRHGEDIVREAKNIHYQMLNLGDKPASIMTDSKIWPLGSHLKSSHTADISKMTPADIETIGTFLIEWPVDFVDTSTYNNVDLNFLTHSIEWVNSDEVTTDMLDSVIATERNALVASSIFIMGRLKYTCNFYLIRDLLDITTPNLFYA